jgi:DNA-directed RNA polymerase subunit RPC12/RpoP
MNNTEDNFTSFLCPSCHTEIEASLDMCGLETECPACGAKITVPQPETEADGVVRHKNDSKVRTQALKSRTIRIELGDL